MQFENEAIESIGQLLASADERNVLLGFELLKHQKGTFDSLLLLFILLRDFYADTAEDTSRIKRNSTKNLNKYPAEKIAANRASMLVLYWADDYRFLEYKEVKKALRLFEKKRSELEPYILSNSIYAELYERLAHRLMDEGIHVKEALYYMETFAKLPNSTLDSRLAYSELVLNEFFIEQKRLEEIPFVIQSMEEALIAYPYMADNYNDILGIIHDVYLGEKQKAIGYYEAVLAKNPNHGGSLNNLANLAYKINGDFDKALDLIQRALKQDKRDIHFLDTYACILWKGFDELEEAEKIFRAIYKRKKSHHASQTGLGEVLEIKGELEEALEWYERGLEIRPNSVFKLKKMADLLYLKLNKPQEALPYYERLLEVAEDKADAMNKLDEINLLSKS